MRSRFLSRAAMCSAVSPEEPAPEGFDRAEGTSASPSEGDGTLRREDGRRSEATFSRKRCVVDEGGTGGSAGGLRRGR